jgi:hypothetical protein
LNNKKRSQVFRLSLTSSFFLLSLIILAACGADIPSDQTPEPEAAPTDTDQPQVNTAVLNQPFTLLVGQSATLDGTGLSITFERVERDGRCPTAVDCVADGPVVVIVSAEQQGAPTTTFTMNPDPILASFEGIAPNTYTLVGYEIELTAVNPHPEVPEDIMNMNYEATFVVTKAE